MIFQGICILREHILAGFHFLTKILPIKISRVYSYFVSDFKQSKVIYRDEFRFWNLEFFQLVIAER